jgi:hypothetical protein
VARRVRLTARYLNDARQCGVIGGTPDSRDVKRVIDVLAGASDSETECPAGTGAGARCTPGATCQIPLGEPCCVEDCACEADAGWTCAASCTDCLGHAPADAGSSRDASYDAGEGVSGDATTAALADACSTDAGCE